MSRERLHRGKRKDNGEWVIGYYFCMHHNDGRTHIHHFIIPIDAEIPKDKPIGEIQVEVIPETVGEYTGLDTDEKTTSIFKNDVIKFDDGNVCFKGRVDKECGAWGIVADSISLNYAGACNNDNFISFWEIMWNSNNPDFIIDDVVPHVEVIGNIHDTPELLEVAECIGKRS